MATRLEQHLAAQDIHVRRDHELTGITQDEGGVTATFASGGVVRSRYLVAADGGHSTVRSLLGAEFPGRPRSIGTGGCSWPATPPTSTSRSARRA